MQKNEVKIPKIDKLLTKRGQPECDKDADKDDENEEQKSSINTKV